MRATVILGFVLSAVVELAAAGEITLSLKQIEGLKFSCILTNASGNQVYVTPFYLEEHFYAQPNCSTCATGWVASRPMVIGNANDYIPLESGAAITFDAIGNPNPNLPWRISCFAVTNSVHVNDNTAPKGRIVIQSVEIPARLPSH